AVELVDDTRITIAPTATNTRYLQPARGTVPAPTHKARRTMRRAPGETRMLAESGSLGRPACRLLRRALLRSRALDGLLDRTLPRRRPLDGLLDRALRGLLRRTLPRRRPLDGLLDRTLRGLLRRTLHRGRALDSFLDRALRGLLGAPLHRAFCGRRSRCRGRRRCGGNRGFTEKACRPRRTSQRWVRRPRGCHPSLPSEDVDHVAIAA